METCDNSASYGPWIYDILNVNDFYAVDTTQFNFYSSYCTTTSNAIIVFHVFALGLVGLACYGEPQLYCHKEDWLLISNGMTVVWARLGGSKKQQIKIQ